MANHPSALKRARQSQRRRMRNKFWRTRVRNVVKAVRKALQAGDPQLAQEALAKAVPVIDKAASKGVIHWRNAARKISRLSRQVHALSESRSQTA